MFLLLKAAISAGAAICMVALLTVVIMDDGFKARPGNQFATYRCPDGTQPVRQYMASGPVCVVAAQPVWSVSR